MLPRNAWLIDPSPLQMASTTMIPIWHENMLLAEQGYNPTNFIVPPGVVQRTVSYPEGITTTDWYIKGIPWRDWGLGWPGSL